MAGASISLVATCVFGAGGLETPYEPPDLRKKGRGSS